jgi:hypothetical protein
MKPEVSKKKININVEITIEGNEFCSEECKWFYNPWSKFEEKFKGFCKLFDRPGEERRFKDRWHRCRACLDSKESEAWDE